MRSIRLKHLAFWRALRTPVLVSVVVGVLLSLAGPGAATAATGDTRNPPWLQSRPSVLTIDVAGPTLEAKVGEKLTCIAKFANATSPITYKWVMPKYYTDERMVWHYYFEMYVYPYEFNGATITLSSYYFDNGPVRCIATASNAVGTTTAEGNWVPVQA